ncbi:unnamed protein product [Rhizophagus irregularis]|nr:unnamed protein product [Rhizophagus irregularis]
MQKRFPATFQSNCRHVYKCLTEADSWVVPYHAPTLKEQDSDFSVLKSPDAVSEVPTKNIWEFLEECVEKTFQRKIEVYLLSLETIADTCLKTEKDPRYEMAQLLLDKHKVDRSDPELGYGTVDNSKNSERKQKESDDDDFQPVPDRQQKRKKNLSLPKDQ